jgi:hypothetical protein
MCNVLLPQCSVVVIVTGYELEGPGIECRWGRNFPHLSRPALGPTQPPVHGHRVFPGGKERPGSDADPSPPSSAVVMKEYSYTSTPATGRTACTKPHCLYNGALYLLLLPPGVNPITVNKIYHIISYKVFTFRSAKALNRGRGRRGVGGTWNMEHGKGS